MKQNDLWMSDLIITRYCHTCLHWFSKWEYCDCDDSDEDRAKNAQNGPK